MSIAGSVTITVILEPVDRHGRWRASLPDGTNPGGVQPTTLPRGGTGVDGRRPVARFLARGLAPWFFDMGAASAPGHSRGPDGRRVQNGLREMEAVFPAAVSPPIRANENVAPDPGLG